MTSRSTLGPGGSFDVPGDARLGGGSDRMDAVLDAHQSQDGPHEDRLVYLPTAALRPHPTYQELCGPIAATRVRRMAQQAGAIREPLLTTTDGTILDGHARWQVATERQQPILPCIEYDLTEEEALQFVIERHRTSEGLNDFCRIRLALHLEPHFRERSYRRQRVDSTNMRASNLTKIDRVDVRADIARVAGASTGNVTKVKQLLETVMPEIREQLRLGALSIHRAWKWRLLPAEQQRDALWKHQNRKDLRQTIRHLIAQHAQSRSSVPAVDQLRAVLGGLATDETALVVADIPGNAIVVTRECYQDLLWRRTNEPHGSPTA